MAYTITEPEIASSIIAHSPEAIILLDSEARVLTCNPAAVELTGYTSEELKGTSIEITYLPAERPLFAQRFSAFKAQKQFRLERPLLRKDGTIRYVELLVAELPDSTIVEFIKDISERREASKALEAQLAFNKALVENSLDVVAILDLNGTVKYESPQDEPSFGYATGELKGMNAFELIHPEDRAKVEETFRMVMSGTERHTVTFRFHAKNGSWIFVQALAINLMDNPYVQGALISMRDITAFKSAQEAAARSDELNKINKVLVGREMKMIELKEEIKRLKVE